MLRTEIEKALVDGSLAVKDLPEAAPSSRRNSAWMFRTARSGVLQDIHWSTCQIGTFCNYTIGNVMAAQLMETARQTTPAIAAGLEIGDYKPLMGWLGEHVHQHGRRFTRRVAGSLDGLRSSPGRILSTSGRSQPTFTAYRSRSLWVGPRCLNVSGPYQAVPTFSISLFFQIPP